MEKTKEEIINEFYKSVPPKHRHFPLGTVLSLMEEYGNQRYKAGFESFRLKAEEEVKKDIGFIEHPVYKNIAVDSLKRVLTTIMEIKE